MDGGREEEGEQAGWEGVGRTQVTQSADFLMYSDVTVLQICRGALKFTFSLLPLCLFLNIVFALCCVHLNKL